MSRSVRGRRSARCTGGSAPRVSCASRSKRISRSGSFAKDSRQDLERDVAIELRIARAVDLAHATGAERAADFIWSDPGAGAEAHEGVEGLGGGIIAVALAQAELARQIEALIAKRGLTQAAAAVVLKIDQPGDRYAVSRMPPRAGRVILPLARPNCVEDEALALSPIRNGLMASSRMGATSRAEFDSVPFCAVIVRSAPRKPPNNSAQIPGIFSTRPRLRRRPYRSPFRIRLRKYSAARIPDSAAPSMKPWKLWKLSVCSPANARFPSGSPRKPSIVVK